MDGEASCSMSCGLYISQLSRFAGVSGHVTDFNFRNKIKKKNGLSLHPQKEDCELYNTLKWFLSSMSDGLKPLYAAGFVLARILL